MAIFRSEFLKSCNGCHFDGLSLNLIEKLWFVWQTDHSSGLQLVLACQLHTAYFGFYGNPYCQCWGRTSLESVKIMFISELVNIMNGEQKILPGINAIYYLILYSLSLSQFRYFQYKDIPGTSKNQEVVCRNCNRICKGKRGLKNHLRTNSCSSKVS